MAVGDIEVGSVDGTKKSASKLVLVLRTLVHVVFFGHHQMALLHGLWYLYKASNHDADKLQEACIYAWGFITNWNMMFQTTFLFIALAYDFLEWRGSQHSAFGQKSKYYRDVIFCGLVTPFTLFVSSFFWVIYFIDRELVFPTVYDEIVPFWFNHCVHTNVTVLLLLETLLQPRRHPTNEKVETWCVASVGVSYAVVYYSIYIFAHRWLYNVFAIMTWWQICLFQICIWAINYFCYRIQFPINRLFHKQQEEESEKTEVTGNNEVLEEDCRDNDNKEDGKNHFVEKSLNLKCRSMKDQSEKTKF